MNKKTYVCVIIILVCLNLITGAYTIIHVYYNYLPSEWFRESVNEGDYVIVGKEIGHPFFFGNSFVQISIYDHINHTRMTSFTTRVDNQGKKLTTDNYRIEYHEDYLKIILINADNQTSVAYRFYFEDFKYGTKIDCP